MKNKKKKAVLGFIVSAAILLSSNRYLSRFSYYSTYNNYTSYDDELCDDSIMAQYDIGELGSFVPQGICALDDCYLVSLYDSKEINNSVIYAIDFDGELLHKTSLDIKAHVGGIAYDETNGLLWVSSNGGCVKAYFVDDVLNNECVISPFNEFYVGDDLINYKNNEAVSFMGIHNNNIVVGSYTLLDKGVMKEYKVNLNDELCSLELVSTSYIPDKVQGVAFYENNEKEYVLFSRSYGRYNKSVLDICLYNEDILDYNDDSVCHSIYEMESMMEQIALNDDGDLAMMHENKAFIYCPDCSLKDIYVADMDYLLELKK